LVIFFIIFTKALLENAFTPFMGHKAKYSAQSLQINRLKQEY